MKLFPAEFRPGYRGYHCPQLCDSSFVLIVILYKWTQHNQKLILWFQMFWARKYWIFIHLIWTSTLNIFYCLSFRLLWWWHEMSVSVTSIMVTHSDHWSRPGPWSSPATTPPPDLSQDHDQCQWCRVQLSTTLNIPIIISTIITTRPPLVLTNYSAHS